MRKITIKVMPRDIKHGRRLDSERCPVALAVNRLLKPEYTATVFPSSLMIFRRDLIVAFADLPRHVRRFVGAFDRGEAVKPISITFTVGILDKFWRLR